MYIHAHVYIIHTYSDNLVCATAFAQVHNDWQACAVVGVLHKFSLLSLHRIKIEKLYHIAKDFHTILIVCNDERYQIPHKFIYFWWRNTRWWNHRNEPYINIPSSRLNTPRYTE